VRHRQSDHRFRHLGLTFVVARQTPISAKPSKRSFMGPTLRQRRGSPAGNLLGLRRGASSESTATLSFEARPPVLRQRRSPSGVGLFRAVAEASPAGVDRLGRLQVRPERRAEGPMHKVITCRFLPLTCLLGSRPRLRPPWRPVGTDWPRDDRGTGRGSPAFGHASGPSDPACQLLKQVLSLPLSEVVVGSPPRRKSYRKHAPLKATFDQMKHSVQKLAWMVLHELEATDDRFDPFPFCVGQVRGIPRGHRSAFVL